MGTTSEFSLRLLVTVVIVTIGPFLYGYHLAELNAPESVITCQNLDPAKTDCIPMTGSEIGFVNGVNAIGGMLGAAIAGTLADKIGRRNTSLFNCVFFVLGPLIMATSHSVMLMSLGRFLSGFGAGSSIVVSPIYVGELAPVSLRGTLGTAVQLSCVTGILFAQVLGLVYSNEYEWRKILSAGGVIGFIAGLLLLTCVESPKWLALNGKTIEAREALVKLRPTDAYIEEEISQFKTGGSETEALLASNSVPLEDSKAPVSAYEFVTSPDYRKYFLSTTGVMVIQQVTGINAIVFYGVSILSASMPEYSKQVNCLISVINLAVTSSVAPTIDRFGRRPLLLGSVMGMIISSALLSLGLIFNWSFLSSISATLFVATFAAGLGPIPYLIISELSPAPTVTIAQSIATTSNWVATFLVGFLFPILKTSLGNTVFFVFTTTGILSYYYIYKFVPETKGKVSAEQVWAAI